MWPATIVQKPRAIPRALSPMMIPSPSTTGGTSSGARVVERVTLRPRPRARQLHGREGTQQMLIVSAHRRP